MATAVRTTSTPAASTLTTPTAPTAPTASTVSTGTQGYTGTPVFPAGVVELRPVPGKAGQYDAIRADGASVRRYTLYNMRAWRMRYGWSYTDLSVRAIVGAAFLRRIERELPLVSIYTVARIARAMGIDSNDLLYRTPEDYAATAPLIHLAPRVVTPTTPMQVTETYGEDGTPQLAFHLPTLWRTALCNPDGSDGESDGAPCAEARAVMEITGLPLEGALRIIFGEDPCPYDAAVRICQRFNTSLLQCAAFLR